MRPSLSRTTGAAVLGLALAAGTTGAAHAASWESYRDATQDVVESVADSSEVVPDVTDPDVVRTRNTHGPRVVKTRVKLRALGYGGHQVAMQLKTPRGTYIVRGTKGGVFDDEVVVVPPPHLDSTCQNGDFRVDRQKATMTLKVSRHCLGNPRWVRVGVSTMAVSDGGVSWVDDSRGKGLLPFDQLRLGPRLTRG